MHNRGSKNCASEIMMPLSSLISAKSNTKTEPNNDNRKTIFRNSTTRLRTIRRRNVASQNASRRDFSSVSIPNTSFSENRSYQTLQGLSSSVMCGMRPLSGISQSSTLSSKSSTDAVEVTTTQDVLARSLLETSLLSGVWSGFSDPSTITPQQTQQAPLAASDNCSYDVSSFEPISIIERNTDKIMDRDFVLINCSGYLFEIRRAVFQNYPQVLEGILHDGFRRVLKNGRTEFFFDRDPEFFRYVLLYCRYDEMHVPNHICGPLLEREMSTWGVPFGVDLQRCCFGHVMNTKSQLESLQRFENAFRDFEESTTDDEEDEDEGYKKKLISSDADEINLLNAEITEHGDNFRKTESGNHNKSKTKFLKNKRKVNSRKGWINAWCSIRKSVWCVLDKPTSSFFAAIYSVIVAAAVMMAIFVFVAGTNRYFQKKHNNHTNEHSPTIHNIMCQANITLFMPNASGSNSKLHSAIQNTFQTKLDFPLTKLRKALNDIEHNSPPRKNWLSYAEYCCIAIFTLDLIARLIFAKNTLRFLRNTYTLVDILSIVPFYFETIYHLNYSLGHPESTLTTVEVIGFLKIALVLRLMRIFRHYRGLQVLMYTLKTSLADLLLIFVLLGLGTLIFATLIYFAEKDKKFISIPHGFWWSLITMTTVGYGDYYPETPAGYIIGAGCVLVGNVLITLTIPILVSNFMLYYSHSRTVMESRSLHAYVTEELNIKLSNLRETLSLTNVQNMLTTKAAEKDAEESVNTMFALANAGIAIALPDTALRRRTVNNPNVTAAPYPETITKTMQNKEECVELTSVKETTAELTAECSRQMHASDSPRMQTSSFNNACLSKNSSRLSIMTKPDCDTTK